jgi:hypothetical protein
MNKINQLTLEFLNFCKDTLREESFLQENIIFETDLVSLQKSLELAKEKLKNVSSRQHDAWLDVKRYEGQALEKLKNTNHRYKDNVQWMEMQVNKIKETAAKRSQLIDKAANATKISLRNTITNLEKQIASIPKTPQKLSMIKQIGSKLGKKGKIAVATGVALAGAGGYAAYRSKKNKVKEDFDYSSLLSYD